MVVAGASHLGRVTPVKAAQPLSRRGHFIWILKNKVFSTPREERRALRAAEASKAELTQGAWFNGAHEQ